MARLAALAFQLLRDGWAIRDRPIGTAMLEKIRSSERVYNICDFRLVQKPRRAQSAHFEV